MEQSNQLSCFPVGILRFILSPPNYSRAIYFNRYSAKIVYFCKDSRFPATFLSIFIRLFRLLLQGSVFPLLCPYQLFITASCRLQDLILTEIINFQIWYDFINFWCFSLQWLSFNRVKVYWLLNFLFS